MSVLADEEIRNKSNLLILQPSTPTTYNTSIDSSTTTVIESYTNALLDVFPQVRYQPMGLFWKVRTFVYTHLPESIFDWIYM